MIYIYIYIERERERERERGIDLIRGSYPHRKILKAMNFFILQYLRLNYNYVFIRDWL